MKSIKSFSQFVNENINESGDSFEIPAQIFDIITQIEARFSRCDGGTKVRGLNYQGDSMKDVFKEYVKATIGFDTWNRLDTKTKSQIYAFAYQMDTTKGKYKYWWVNGLAQAVDPTVNRATITPEAAIEIIKSAKNLANIYSSYLKIVKQQCKNVTLEGADAINTDCNRAKVWGPRPDAIDRMLNGEDHKKVLDDWQKTYIDEATSNSSDINNTSSTETTSTDNSQEKKSGATFRSDSLNGLIKQINQGELVDNRNGFDLSKPVTIDFKEGRYILNAPGGKDGFFTLKLALNIVADNQANSFPAKESLANQGYKVWNEGTFQLTGEGLRDWALMYKK
jgi:hypothetical protein